MKTSSHTKITKRSGRKSSPKRIKPIIPAGFHPLSEKMADVLVAMQEKFVHLPEWWRQGAQVRKLTVKYYQALRQVLRESAPSQRLLIRCCHCDIFF